MGTADRYAAYAGECRIGYLVQAEQGGLLPKHIDGLGRTLQSDGRRGGSGSVGAGGGDGHAGDGGSQ